MTSKTYNVPTITLSSFTNPNGERVHQVFSGGMPVTRELEYERARASALELAGSRPLERWDGDTGKQWTEAIS